MKVKITFALVNKLKRELKDSLPDKEYEIRDTELKGFVLRVKPSGNMVYTMVYARGRRVTIGTADQVDSDQARIAAKKISAEHVNAEQGLGEDPIKARRRSQTSNYLQFVEGDYQEYLTTHLRGGNKNAEHVKETMACLKNRFEQFHKLRLEEISPQLIEKWRQGRLNSGAKPATINRNMNDLRACLNKAIEWGALAVNPFEKVKPSKTDSNRKVRYLSDKEELNLRKSLDERESKIKASRERANEWRSDRGYELYAGLSDHEFADYLKPAVLLSLNTGLRRGELFNLKWSDIDFKQKNLTVVGEDTATGQGTKTGQTRHIPLNDEALEVLKYWKQQPGLKSEWVFHDKNGEQFENLRKSWMAVLEKAKIENFRWHDMRHDFASKLVIAGVDLNTVRELLGHSDYKMTLRYAHLAPKVKHEAVQKLVAASAQ
jgi:integrase